MAVSELLPDRVRRRGRDQDNIHVTTATKRVDGGRQAPWTTGRPHKVSGTIGAGKDVSGDTVANKTLPDPVQRRRSRHTGLSWLGRMV